MEMQAQKLVPKLARLMGRVSEIIRIHRHACNIEKSCVSGQNRIGLALMPVSLMPNLARNYSE